MKPKNKDDPNATKDDLWGDDNLTASQDDAKMPSLGLDSTSVSNEDELVDNAKMPGSGSDSTSVNNEDKIVRNGVADVKKPTKKPTTKTTCFGGASAVVCVV